MNKQRKTSHILNVFQYDADGHVGLPASLTLGIAPTGEDNSGKVPTTAWVRSVVGGAVTAYTPTSRTITINGTSYDLSSNRAWSIDTGVLTATAGSGISVSVVNQNLNIVNTGILTASSGAGISLSVVNQNLNVVNTGILTASAGLGISLSVVGQNLNVVNTGILTASAGSGISLSVVGQNLNVVNTGVLTATAGAGISLSVVNGNLNVVNTITNNNQLTNGAGYITSSALTGYATETYVGTAISNLVDAAPGTLDTLNELAAALGDDPNFATTVATSIGTKQAQLNGTGFVKVTGTTVSYDNSTYLTTSSAASTYVALAGSYANPAWITSLAWSKVTGAPAFITSYTETDTLASVTGRGASTSTQVTFSGAGDGSSTYSSVRFAGYNQGGGVGYHGFFEVQNTYGSVTNGKKFFRIDGTGSIQIINSAYTANIFNLTDAGALTVASIIKSGGTSAQILAADGSVITAGSGITISGGTISSTVTGGVSSFNTRTGAVTLSSSDVTTALGYTPYNSTNPNGYISSYTETDTLATVTSRGASTTAGITVNGRVTAAGGGTYAVTGSSTQRYIIQALNTSNSVNSSYGWWWFHNANGDMGFHADAVGDILTLTRGGGATINGNTILTAGNYTSYSPSLTGSGASGTWGINITGDAGSIGGVSVSRIIYGDNSTGTTYISNATLDGALKSGFYTVGSGGIPNASSVNFVLHTAYYGVGNLAGFDLACNDSTTSQFYLRPATGGGKGAWQTIVTNSGTWSISITGNAATLGGYGPNQTGGANTIVQRDANGYIQNSYFYSSGGGSERNGSGLGYVAGFNSSDYYIRSYNSTAVASFLGLGSMAYASTGSYLPLSGGTMTGTLAMHQGAYYGTITFGSSDYWRAGISMRDASNAELRIWAKGGGAGSIYFATGFDGESSSATLPSDGMALKNNNLGIGGWAYNEFPSYKLHVKGTGYATNDFRAPIFYDSNDTNYYLDPNGGSVLSTVRTALKAARGMNGYSGGSWIDDFTNTPVSSMTFGEDKSSGGPAGTWWFQVNMRHQNGSSIWGTQLAYGWEDNANRILQRNVTGGTWSSWVEYLNSNNYTTWVPTKTGGGASGTWSISVTGSAATAFGVSNTPDSWYGFGQSTSAGGATAVGGYYPWTFSYHTGLAFNAHSAYGGIRFYNQQYPTAPMHGDPPPLQIINDGVKINGNAAIHAGNIGSQSVSYAATAGNANGVAWSNVSGRPSSLSQFSNDSGYITSSGSISGNAGSANVATYARRIDGVSRVQITVGGNASTFYPVALSTGAGSTSQQYSEFVIERGGYDDPGYSGIGFSTFNARFSYKPSGWGYGAVYWNLEQLGQTTTMLADYDDYYQASQFVVWLRGATTYWIWSVVGGIGVIFENTSGTSYNATYRTFGTTTSVAPRASYTKNFYGNLRVDNNIYSGGGFVSGYNVELGGSDAGNVVLSTYNNRNLRITGTGGGDVGICGRRNGGSFGFQIYGEGGSYGFLNSEWGSWNLKKVISGALYMNDNNSYYINTTGDSYFSGALTLGGALAVAGVSTLNGQVNINRHIDANTNWGSCGCTSIFLGWSTSKVIIGNGNSGGHDYANGLGSNSVVSTNPFYCYQDITAYSDSRVKENVEVVENAVEKVKAIRGVTFTRNDVEDKNKRHAGVIAQEVLAVLPEAVSEDLNGHYSVAYGNLNALLIEAIKEQQKQIEELQNKLDNVLSSR